METLGAISSLILLIIGFVLLVMAILMPYYVYKIAQEVTAIRSILQARADKEKLLELKELHQRIR